MAAEPEARALAEIDRLLGLAEWNVCDLSLANLNAHRGVAIREFCLKPADGSEDYLLCMDGGAGIIPLTKNGVTPTGVETPTDKCTDGLPQLLRLRQALLPSSSELRPVALDGSIRAYHHR